MLTYNRVLVFGKRCMCVIIADMIIMCPIAPQDSEMVLPSFRMIF